MTFIASLLLATHSTRLLPLVFKRHVSKLLNKRFFKNHLGDLIIFFLIIYCYRDFGITSEYLLRLTMGAIVFIIQWKKDSALLSIFLGTGFYMLGRIIV
ncbi:MAG: AzlD domain-containing protein [Bacteriovoracaceae bacterium]